MEYKVTHLIGRDLWKLQKEIEEFITKLNDRHRLASTNVSISFMEKDKDGWCTAIIGYWLKR